MIDRNALTVIDGDARISCRSLQVALGYSAVRHVHDLIRRHHDELSDYGKVFVDVSKNPSAGPEGFSPLKGKSRGGRPVTTYYLNEHQATAVCMWAETPKARAGRKLMVEVFTAWRKGQLPDLPASAVDPFAEMAGRSGMVRDHLLAIAAMPALAREATHLPIWSNGRRPDWWGQYELRAFVTESHRQMTLAACCAQIEARFGWTFSVSSLQRYWAALDKVVGPDPRSPKKKEAA